MTFAGFPATKTARIGPSGKSTSKLPATPAAVFTRISRTSHSFLKYRQRQEGLVVWKNGMSEGLAESAGVVDSAEVPPEPSIPRPWQRMLEPALQYLGLGVEAGNLAYPIRIGLVCLLWNQAHNLALRHDRTVVLRQLPHCRVNLPYRRRPEVGNVHAHLGAAVRAHAQRLHPVQSASRGADGAGNRARRGDAGMRCMRRPAARRLPARIQVDVVRNQEAPRSHRGGPGGAVDLRTAHIRPPGHVPVAALAQSLKLAAADVLQ